mmetsp:Transcript_887/g.2496  ORF Transcript_887/g.2496 Transcript_887/m.2496 type:complete len:239 (+) Transcript_887:48-764(+)
MLALQAGLALLAVVDAFHAPVMMRRQRVKVKAATDDAISGLTEKLSEFSASVPTNVVDSLKNDSGSAQALVVAQLSLLGMLLIGAIPFVGGALEFVSGPGFLLGGAALAVSGVLELGPKNLTPSSTPVQGNELKTNGVYAYSRHPMYTGLLLMGTGLAIVTHSFQRILITALLYALCDFKADKEEEALSKIHPAYPAYQSTVPKLLPGIDAIFGDDGYLYSSFSSKDKDTDPPPSSSS